MDRDAGEIIEKVVVTADTEHDLALSGTFRAGPTSVDLDWTLVERASGTIIVGGVASDMWFTGDVTPYLDEINLRELYLGYASNLDEGALVISDRVVELALDRVWPMLGPQPRGDRLQLAYAGAVNAEARRDLPGGTIFGGDFITLPMLLNCVGSSFPMAWYGS